MGEAFKRQLKYDGTYSRITFICSKTDDISITEATDSLGIDEEMAADWERIDSINNEKKFLKQTLKDLQESRVVYTEMMSDADDLLDIWEVCIDPIVLHTHRQFVPSSPVIICPGVTNECQTGS